MGDYAESVARQILHMSSMPSPPDSLRERIVEMANLAIPMLHDSIEAFVQQDPTLARGVILSEPAVDALLGKLIAEVVEALRAQTIMPEMAEPLVTIGRALRARRRPGAQRVHGDALHVHGRVRQAPGRRDLPRAVRRRAQRLPQPDGRGDRAVARAAEVHLLERRASTRAPIDPRTLAFMREKGFDMSRMAPKAIYQVPNLDHYQVIVGVAQEAQQAFPRSPRKMVYIDWSIDDPSRLSGSDAEVRAAYEATFRFLSSHVRDLVGAVLGVRIE